MSAPVSSAPRILVGGTVRQDAETLALFVRSLGALSRYHAADVSRGQLSFMFYDDNDDTKASELLRSLSESESRIVRPDDKPAGAYVRTDQTHHWNDALVWRVAKLKNAILDAAQCGGYDFVFLIDSDVLLTPDTLARLVREDKDVLSNIFWTMWQPNTQPMPQVWQCDTYTMSAEFIATLHSPGVYEVGGLGACTLISKRALDRGVSFSRLHNVSFWGEDRHFCIRAVALGLSLWVDTRDPSFHVYRKSDIAAGDAFLSLHDR